MDKETEHRHPDTEKSIGVALSGGGLRASLHGLGVLLYLVDARLNQQVKSIVSVSGGSITNAAVWLGCDFTKTTPEEFRQVARKIGTFATQRGLFPSLPYIVYLALLLALTVLGVAGLIATWVPYWPPVVAWGVLLSCALAVGTGWFLRGMVLSRLMRLRLLNRDGHRCRLGELERNVEHVFCATDLNHGTPVFFTTWNAGQLYSNAHGWTCCNVPIELAVRASAALPGAFPPMRMRIALRAKETLAKLPASYEESDQRWQTEYDTRGLPESRKVGSWLFLADGGVWNNLATSWWSYDSRELDFDSWSPLHNTSMNEGRATLNPNVKVVVNSSARFEMAPTRGLSLPWLGEFLALGRVLQVLYQNTVFPRVAAIRFRNLLAYPETQQEETKETEDYNAVINLHEDAMIQLRSNFGRAGSIPDDVMERFQSWQKTHGRPSAITSKKPKKDELFTLDYEGYERWRGSSAWAVDNRVWRAASEGAAVPTTLGRVEVEAAVALLEHGYICAMANLHVLHDSPVVAIPSRDEFRSLLIRSE